MINITQTEKTFVLERSEKLYGDGGEPTTVTIRKATAGDVSRRQDMFATFDHYTEGGREYVRQEIPLGRMARYEIYLTLAGCNLVDDDGKPYFRFKNRRPASEAEFFRRLDALPPDVVREIHEKVLEVNDFWKFGNAENF